MSERQDEDDPEVMPTEDVNGGLAYRYIERPPPSSQQIERER